MIAEFMTVSGRRMDLADIALPQICIEDIAWHLAMTCRFGGAVKTWYSNAQHSVLVCDLVRAALQHLGLPEGWRAEPKEVVAALPVAGLVHDAPEAYTGDLTRPMKLLLRFYSGMSHGRPFGEPSVFDAVEYRIGAKVEAALQLPRGLVTGDHPIYWMIKQADLRALQIEDAVLRPHTKRDLNADSAAFVEDVAGNDVEAYCKRYIELGRSLREDRWPTAERAAEGFLASYFELTKNESAAAP